MFNRFGRYACAAALACLAAAAWPQALELDPDWGIRNALLYMDRIPLAADGGLGDIASYDTVPGRRFEDGQAVLRPGENLLLRLSVVPVVGRQLRWHIEFGEWNFKSVAMLYRTAGGRFERQECRLDTPVALRRVNSRNVTFELPQTGPAGGQPRPETVYFYIQNSSSQVRCSVSVGLASLIDQRQSTQTILISGIVAAFVMFCLVGLAMWSGSRERVWGMFSALSACSALLYTITSGLGLELYGTEAMGQLIGLYPALELLHLALGLSMMMQFLEFKRGDGALYWMPALSALGLVAASAALSALPDDLLVSVKVPAMLLAFGFVSAQRIVLSLVAMAKRRFMARLYLGAFGVEIFGTWVYVLRSQGLLANSPMSAEFATFGAIAMFVLLCFGLSVRVRRLTGLTQESNARLAGLNAELEEMVAQRTAELESERNRMAVMAMEDELTGLMSRRKILDQLETESQRFRRYGAVFSVMMIDLDHFKRVNDAYGHQAGDQVLRQSAEVLRKVLRESDLCGRLGGEEILVILPETAAPQAMSVAEKLRESMADCRFTADSGEAYRVTCSIGVAQAKDGRPSHELLHQADLAMYRAKEAGRNRTALAG